VHLHVHQNGRKASMMHLKMHVQLRNVLVGGAVHSSSRIFASICRDRSGVSASTINRSKTRL
jgi:hypothetical protein